MRLKIKTLRNGHEAFMQTVKNDGRLGKLMLYIISGRQQLLNHALKTRELLDLIKNRNFSMFLDQVFGHRLLEKRSKNILRTSSREYAVGDRLHFLNQN